jgi:hypothetical protein
MLVRGLIQLPTTLRRRRFARAWQAYKEIRKPLSVAPYPIEMYVDFLERASTSDDVRLLPFTARAPHSSKQCTLFVRHDIDTRDCARNLSALLDVDLRFGIRSGVYLRADGREYLLRDLRDRLQQYRASGLEIGLHTLCYLDDDYLDAFAKEREGFIKETGLPLTSFTIHGMGTLRRETRASFVDAIGHHLSRYGYTFTDAVPSLRHYDYVLEDCHLSADQQRIIYDDLSTFPSRCVPGSTCLLLTHPCYWTHPGG